MKGILSAVFVSLLFLPLSAFAGEQLIPAGSLIQCTIAEPSLSSKTLDVGDPVLCQISHFQLYGRPVFPYGSYLVGRFEEYKDPGHFVGKGWMELQFDHLAMPPDQELSVEAKVVAVPGYPVDKKGRIDGKGHPVRDTVEWSIPILWPIDLLNLPRRGPRPVLKAETSLTLKIMDDVMVPTSANVTSGAYSRDSEGFAHRAPMSYAPPPAATSGAQQIQYGYAPPTQRLTILATRDGVIRYATRYWFEGGQRVVYVTSNGKAFMFPIEHLDLTRTIAMNRKRGVNFVIRSAND